VQKNSFKETMLVEQEIIGLKNTLWIRLLYFFVFAVSTPFGSESLLETVVSITISFVIIALTVFFLYSVSQGKRLRFAGRGAAIIDVFVLGFASVIFYISIGGEAVTPAYNFKNLTLLMAAFFILINSMAFQPEYPMIISIGMLTIFIGHFVYAVKHGGVVFTDSLVEDFMGDKLNPGVLFFKMLILLGMGTLAFLVTRRARTAVKKTIELEKKRGQLSRYFSPNLVSTIETAKEDFLKPGGTSQNVAVLFCDIRGFTPLSEKYSADKVIEMLSDYHEHMVEQIFKHGGTLDKFIGDAIMATFGTPIPTENDAENALLTAIDMKQSLAELNEIRERKGEEKIQNGIGIHYGQVVAGNIGTHSRLEYTVIGDTVNTASRIEGYCRSVKHDILFSAALKDKLAGTYSVKRIGRAKLKGKSEPVELFTIEDK
jgi:adenylate cyclase